MGKINGDFGVRIFGLMFMLCVLGIHSSYADVTIDVLNTECGLTYNLTLLRTIEFLHNASDETPYVEFLNTTGKCVFHIINTDVDMEMCITHDGTIFSVPCILSFEYHVGTYDPDRYYYDKKYSCIDFSSTEPLCTRETNSYAVFKKTTTGLLSPFTIQIYLRQKTVTTTRTFYTSSYRPTNTEDLEESPSHVVTIVVGVVVVIILLFGVLSVYSCMRRKGRYSSGAHPVRYTSQCSPYQTTQQTTFTSESNGVWQVHSPVIGGMTPSAPLYQTNTQYVHPQPQIDSNSNQNTDTNDPTLSDPPPSYTDLDFGTSDITTDISDNTQGDSGDS